VLVPDDFDITIPEEGAAEWLAVTDDEFIPEWDIKRLREMFLPAYARSGEDPLRDAHLKAMARMHNLVHADTIRLMAAQQSPRFADGVLLEAWGDETGIAKIPSETEGAYRRRLLVEQTGITPRSIKEAVRAELAARFQPKNAVFVETKRDFAFRASTAWPSGSPLCYRQNRIQSDSAPGRVWASGRRTGLRTAGAYRMSAAAPPEIWVLVPGSISGYRGFKGVVERPLSPGQAPTGFYGSWAGRWYHTVRISRKDAQSMTSAVRAIASRVMEGVSWHIQAEPALAQSIVR